METVIAAIVAAAGVSTAAAISGFFSFRVASVKHKTVSNTDRAEALSETLWETIDRLRAENRRLIAQRDKLQQQLNELGDTE